MRTLHLVALLIALVGLLQLQTRKPAAAHGGDGASAPSSFRPPRRSGGSSPGSAATATLHARGLAPPEPVDPALTPDEAAGLSLHALHGALNVSRGFVSTPAWVWTASAAAPLAEPAAAPPLCLVSPTTGAAVDLAWGSWQKARSTAPDKGCAAPAGGQRPLDPAAAPPPHSVCAVVSLRDNAELAIESILALFRLAGELPDPLEWQVAVDAGSTADMSSVPALAAMLGEAFGVRLNVHHTEAAENGLAGAVSAAVRRCRAPVSAAPNPDQHRTRA